MQLHHFKTFFKIQNIYLKMKALRGASSLEYNAPGCIVSVRIPSSEISRLHGEGVIIDINCKTFICKLLPKVTPRSVDILTENKESMLPHLAKPLVTNRYDNIIDQLERKYYSGNIIQQESSVDSDESESAEEDAGLSTTNATKPEKRKFIGDDYDVDDPFIDDDEIICEVEAEMKMKRTKTKHDGFFVSSGRLEVFSPKKASKPPSSKCNNTSAPKQQSAVSSTVAVAASQPEPTAAEDVGNPREQKEAKKRKRRTKKEMEELSLLKEQKNKDTALSPTQLAARVASHGNLMSLSASVERPPLTSPSADSSNTTEIVVENSNHATSDGNATLDEPTTLAASNNGSSKPKVEKEMWEPPEPVLQAMTQFAEKFNASGIKLAKSSNIPKSLEEALNEVDTAVLRHFSPDTLFRTVGYFEGLQAAMGGEIQVGKIRSLMVRLRLRDRASGTFRVVEDQMRSLMSDLKSSLAPCPEKLQPSFKAAKKEKALLAKAVAVVDNESGAVAANSESGDKDSTAERGDGAAQSSSLTAATPAGSNSPTNPSSTASTALPALSVLANLATTPAASTTPSGGSAAASSSASSSGALMRYDYVCNWTRPMKVLLCEIEQNLKLWVVQENQYRDKLTVQDKKYMDDRDTAILVEKDVISGYLALICSELPESCLQGNVLYMRRVISMMKVSKDKEKIQKRGAQEKVALSGSSANSAASGDVVGVCGDSVPDNDISFSYF